MAINFALVSVASFFMTMIFIMVYLISSKISMMLSLRRVEKTYNKLKLLMTKHLIEDKLKGIPGEEISRVKKLIHSYVGIEAFNKVFTEILTEYNNAETLKIYAEMIVDYKILLNRKVLKINDKLKQEYVLHLIARYEITTDEVMDYAFKSLGASSLNIRNAALRVVENSHNPEFIIKVYEIITKDGSYFNDKIIIDFIDSFKGVHNELNKRLAQNVLEFSEQIQISIIEHFVNEVYSEGKDEVLKLMGKASSKEVKIAGLKFFKKIPHEPALEFILKGVRDDSYEVRAIAASALASYKGKESLKALKIAISDFNWFVRYNSAFSIIALIEENYLNSEVIKKIIEGKDKYAREIMIYALFAKNIIDINVYNELIIDGSKEEKAS